MKLLNNKEFGPIDKKNKNKHTHYTRIPFTCGRSTILSFSKVILTVADTS